MPRKKMSIQEPEYDDVIKELPEDETFSIGQVWEDCAVTTIACVICGATELNVGIGSFFTAVSCPHCKWQKCVHDG
jgi:hypothetical protein